MPSTFPSQKCENMTVSEHFETRMWFCAAGARDSAPCQKWAKSDGFVAVWKTLAGVEDLQRLGHWFPEKGCIFEHQIFRFVKMSLRHGCGTPYDLASLLRGRHNTLDRWNGKIAKRIGTRPPALPSRRFFSFLMLSQNCFAFDIVKFKNWKISQNCFAFDIVKFKNWKISQNCCAADSDVVKFKIWGCLAE